MSRAMSRAMSRKTSQSSFVSIATLLGVSVFVVAPPASATEADATLQAGNADTTPSVASAPRVRLPVYQPPRVGKPARTIGGGSRGPGDGYPELYVLVPAHVAQTALEQPSLFWYVDEVPKLPMRVDFTLLDEDGVDPLVQVSLAAIERAGIHRIRLSDYGVKLQPGIEYEWSVSLVPDEKARSKDIVATGWIDRVEASSGTDAKSMNEENKDGAVHAFASKGLWYDALAEIDDQIRAQPNDKELSAMRAALLRQVGLEDVANASL